MQHLTYLLLYEVASFCNIFQPRVGYGYCTSDQLRALNAVKRYSVRDTTKYSIPSEDLTCTSPSPSQPLNPAPLAEMPRSIT
ncbi:hypothetical protein J6590_103754 [Homalodisca vitripennis]|nr:hypothetical protein J6590_103754 [Homalodisca vitripennis]